MSFRLSKATKPDSVSAPSPASTKGKKEVPVAWETLLV